MNGMIFNIQRFCVSDGPGIRTTVFFKGCPLRCLWCHNPESQAKEKQIMFYPDKCSGCGRCRGLTVDSSDFICFNNAKEICGKTVSSDYVITEILKDLEFYKNSGGGITLSGGEPLLQFEFALDILKKAKANDLHTAIETCGFADKSKIIKIAEYTDLFLFDFKEGNPKRHKAYTGADNGLILNNLSLLNELKKDILLRCPIIPGYNDRQENYDKICELANTFTSIIGIEIEPYHAFGESKYETLGRQKLEISTQADEQINEIIDYITEKTKVSVKRA
jgi:pyruvate formate lyase activating enzyme